jgi:bifunctional DNA-binding transcriptional regulator/antitoxin component of YhaV-PrlF toxin-antitoxin module
MIFPSIDNSLRALAMRGTITARGQTVIPAPIRARFALVGPSQRLEWIVEADGSIRVPPRLRPSAAWDGLVAPASA